MQGNSHEWEDSMKTSGGREVPVNGLRYEGPGSVRKEPDAQPNAVDDDLVMVYDSNLWLHQRLKFWQRQLRLQDWQITAQFATYTELGSKSGALWDSREVKSAHIRILAFEENPPRSQSYGTWDREVFLVHELVHLFYLDWETSEDKEDPVFIAKEQAVELLSCALVRLSRGEER